MTGPFEINLTPQETPWSTPLDPDDEHATCDAGQVASYVAAATRAALVLAALDATPDELTRRSNATPPHTVARTPASPPP